MIAYFSYKPNLCVYSHVPYQTKEKGKQKGERPEQRKPKFPTKSDLIKLLLIHDDYAFIFDLMGNDLKSQFMTYLWFGIRKKH